MNSSPALVAVGIVIAEDHVLICQRPPEKTLPGLWEFPGGKLEEGEEPRAALIREIREELGVEIEVGRPYEILHHTYEFGTFLVMVFLCQIIEGTPVALEHSQIKWVNELELSDYQFLPADHNLINKLSAEMPIWFR